MGHLKVGPLMAISYFPTPASCNGISRLKFFAWKVRKHFPEQLRLLVITLANEGPWRENGIANLFPLTTTAAISQQSCSLSHGYFSNTTRLHPGVHQPHTLPKCDFGAFFADSLVIARILQENFSPNRPNHIEKSYIYIFSTSKQAGPAAGGRLYPCCSELPRTNFRSGPRYSPGPR